MYIDTHCHLNFKRFGFDYDDIIKQTLSEDIWIVIVGTNYTTSKRACEIATSYNKGVFASIGVHPVHITKQIIHEEGDTIKTAGENFKAELYKELAYATFDKSHITREFIDHPDCCGKVVAIGETGLDYAYFLDKNDHEQLKIINIQKKVLCDHIKLADELQLPLIFHARGKDANSTEVYDDLIYVLQQERIKYPSGLHGVIHAFNGTADQAMHFINMGFLIGIGGQMILNKKLKDATSKIPLNKIVLETDSPYLIPKIGGNAERNEPKNITIIAKTLAEVKSVSIYEISRQTTHNAMELFGMKC